MSIKHVLCPARVRRIPAQFSWIDQRLVRDKLMRLCSADALVLYLFLVTVADAHGLSYYADQSILSRLACFDTARLAHARSELQHVGWIAYEKPLYQVLAIDDPTRSLAALPPKPDTPRPTGQPIHIGEILRRALEGRHDQL